MKLLIIEDEKEIIDYLKSSFVEQGFVVDTVSNGINGSYMARTNEYDLILLDHILPGKNGFEICNDIRREGKHTPIIMLSVKSDIDHKVNLLNSGVDDYLAKPFSFNELVARIRAILRRPRDIKGDILIFDDLILDVQKQTVLRNGKKLYLTRKEFGLLEYLMKNSRVVLSRGMIMEHVWDSNGDPFSNTIESHILKLRKKTEAGSGTRLIHSVPGRGYKLDLEK